jgi:hypothetical protein
MAESAEIRVSEGVTLTGMDPGWAHSRDLQQVFLWDIGPEKPKSPHKPTLPQKAKDGEPEYELAKVEFQELLEEYQAELKNFKKAKQEFNEFQERNGGPIELLFWSIDARHAMEHDVAAWKAGKQSRPRYYLSSRTRGNKHLPNRGLPEGMKPGHGQAEVERRANESSVLLGEAMRADPIFGTQELR